MSGRAKGTGGAAGLAKVRAFLDAWDPKALLSRGAPEDEYNPEAANIYAALISGEAGSEEALAGRIAATFAKWFGDPVALEACSGVAHSIWSWWRDEEAKENGERSE